VPAPPPFPPPFPASFPQAPIVTPHGTRVAIDWHGVLDTPAGPFATAPVCQRNVAAVQALWNAGYTPWILSYIGTGGPHSHERTLALRAARAYLAGQLGLSTEWPDGPSRHAVFCLIVRSTVGEQGKVAALERYNCGIVLDDRQLICRACEDADISVFRCRTGGRPHPRDEPDTGRYYSDGTIWRDLPAAIAQLLQAQLRRGFVAG